MISPEMQRSYNPFITSKHQVHCAKYSTSLDPRGYIPVFEYTVCEQPILWDRETGYVYWTGIWKAMGREKSEIAKLIDSKIELSGEVKKIRGGFLKIQGTWLRYERAYELAKKTCWYIREDLEPIFGPQFLMDVLNPSHADSSSRVPIPLEERKSKAIVSALSRQRTKSLKSGMVSPPATPKLSSKDETPSPVKVSKRKRDSGSAVRKHEKNSNPEVSELEFVSVNDGLDPVMLAAEPCSNQSSFPPLFQSSFMKSPKRRYEESNCEFQENSYQLSEAVAASLCLQRLSMDDGSCPLNEVVSTPPPSFTIGRHEFICVGEQYRLAAKC